ncbi:MAG: hypothetical protein NTZ27_05250 [Ignavibacteriales bacterium]|nr:hypothetical protein [Ignavibacteriales bacterium]
MRKIVGSKKNQSGKEKSGSSSICRIDFFTEQNTKIFYLNIKSFPNGQSTWEFFDNDKLPIGSIVRSSSLTILNYLLLNPGEYTIESYVRKSGIKLEKESELDFYNRLKVNKHRLIKKIDTLCSTGEHDSTLADVFRNTINLFKLTRKDFFIVYDKQDHAIIKIIK